MNLQNIEIQNKASLLRYQATFNKIFQEDDELNSPYQLKEQKSFAKGKPMVKRHPKVEFAPEKKRSSRELSQKSSNLKQLRQSGLSSKIHPRILSASQKKESATTLLSNNSYITVKKNQSNSPLQRDLPESRVSIFNIFGRGVDQSKIKKSLKQWNQASLIMKFYHLDAYKLILEINDVYERQIQNKNENVIKMSKELEDQISPLLSIIHQLKANVKNEEEFNNLLQQLNEIGLQTKNPVFSAIVQYKIGRIYQIKLKYFNAISFFKTSKNQIKLGEFWEIRMKNYLALAECMIKIKQFNLSDLYTNKMLQAAWYLNDHKYELKAFDLTGINAYYLYNIQKARYYHMRAMLGAFEAPDSEIRKLGMKKVQRAIVSIALKMQNRKIKIIKQLPSQEKNKIHEIPFSLHISSSDEEKIQLPINEVEDSIDLAKLGVIRRNIQDQSNTSLQNYYKRQMNKRSNAFIHSSKEDQECMMKEDQLYYAVYMEGQNKVSKNCNVLSNVNARQQFNHQSYIRDTQNYETISTGQTNSKEIEETIKVEHSEKRIRKIIHLLNKLLIIVNQCQIKIAALHQESRKRKGIMMPDCHI